MRFFAPIHLHLHSIGPRSPGNGVQNNSNITTGIINDTPTTGQLEVSLSLRSWATGESLRSWNISGPLPAYSSHNLTTTPAAELLGTSHTLYFA